MTFRLLSSGPLRVGLVSGLAVVGLVLSGCAGSDPQRGGTPSASVSETSSATPTPTPTPSSVYKPADAKGRAENVPVPVLPEEAKSETKEGLQAFARYWYSTLSYAYETGDMAPMQSISSSTCASCTKIKAEVEEWNREGRWMAGGKMVVQAVESNFTETAPSEYQVIVQAYQETIDFYLPGGNLKGSLPRQPAIGDIMIAVHNGSVWQANRIEHLVNQ
ncbi:DUF6318 family protein [Arthrobacter sp. ISL-30]|uniref:DUF6318 family protein n=1 Tax=Arthrobacter sp. ISL-30 TaxID=2819109 RepID=UPI001BEB2A2F|nr:DUF6318 family protein [Arthrobacter sp. ISL-30]MBT2515253.1 hypothetical protein [Arthrobacter sp. ISL-30]